MREVQAGELTAARRRVYFHLVAADGITPATSEAGGQPQISSDGAAWTSTGVGVLVAVGNGRYYADLTTTAVATAGTEIETRYKSAGTAECPGDSVLVTADDPAAGVRESLGTGAVELVSPLSTGGDVMYVRSADDYYAADRQVWGWQEDGAGWPVLTGATVRWVPDSGTAITMTTVVATGSNKEVRLEMTATQSAAQSDGLGWAVKATLSNTHVVTLVAGKVRMV